jgi:2-dehydro-3-deoxyphosphooctonate aldolase (KDO 8-P synthase)
VILIAGPCVIESRQNLFKIAKDLEKVAKDSSKEFYFKASFDKANRTSIESFRGLGIDEGLRLLEEIKSKFGYKILTDIHLPSQAKVVAEVADVLQIPAFLSRQTDLIVEAAKTDAIINIKKGQFLSPEAMKHSVKKVLKTRGCEEDPTYEISKKYKVWLTERGTMFGYGDLIVDMRSLVIMRKFAPVIFDATHSVQSPASSTSTSGGNREYVPYLAKAAAGVGVDGFFFETHFDPSIALSDGANMIKLPHLYRLLEEIEEIRKVLS